MPSANRTDFFGAATGAGSVFSLAGVAGSETIKSDESAKSVCEQLFSLRRDGREYCNRFGGDDGGEMVRGVIVTTQFGLVVRAVVVGGDSGSFAAPLSSGIVTTRGRSPTLILGVLRCLGDDGSCNQPRRASDRGLLHTRSGFRICGSEAA